MKMRFRNVLIAAVAAVFGAGVAAKADTITIHDVSQDTVNGVYVYSISLDSAANVQAGSDGFVIYDFAGETSYSITGDFTTTDFVLTQPATSNTLTTSGSVDAIAFVTALVNGIPFDTNTPNLNFTYAGATNPFLGVANATLTVHTSVVGGITKSVDGTVDHSGPGGTTPFGYSSNPLFVPDTTAQTPLPASSLGGVALLGLLGLARMKKAARTA